MRTTLWRKLLTNNQRFPPEHTEYRRVFLLNALLFATLGVCVSFAVLNAAYYDFHPAFFINTITTVFAAAILFYFHKTDSLNTSTMATVLLLLSALSAFLIVGQHTHYSLYWICVFPPVVYFLLGRKKGRIVTVVYCSFLFALILSRYDIWENEGFTFASVYNIIGATFGLILMISYFELSRTEFSLGLEQKNKELEDKKNQLRLILDSTAEAIYGVDNNGNCTFCNKSCLSILGYNSQEDLLGQNMHWKIHHTRSDGTTLPMEECNIYKAFKEGKGAHSSNEVFWLSDGTSFYAEYSSYPQYMDGATVGSVVSFKDITERKKAEERIRFLSSHDSLTGLYNRSSLKDALIEIDNADNLPLSVIFGDVNGLKLTNDIFGHSAGDELLINAARILKNACNDDVFVARVGGDEFIILLPGTPASGAERIIMSIKQEFSKTKVDAIMCSISLGFDTKTELNQDIERIMENAENRMYKEKTLNRKEIDTHMVQTIIETLHERCPREKQHSVNVGELCKKIGYAMKLPPTDIKKAKDAGYLHDIGKIVINQDIVKKCTPLTEEEKKELQQHSVVGYRILNLFSNTLDLAEGVYCHHEAWNGSGYPKGLKGEEIPRLSRIITVAEAYDALLTSTFGTAMSKEDALLRIKAMSGIKLDPEIVDCFMNILSEEKQPLLN